MVIILEVK